MLSTIAASEIGSLISNNSKKLLHKLVNSEFYIHLKVENQETFVNTVCDDESTFIRLFPSKNEYEHVETDISPMRLRFDIIYHILKNLIDGFIIYSDSREFILDGEFLEKNIAPFTAEELKQMSENLTADGKSLQDTIFLSLLLSGEDYSKRSSNGIIAHEPDMHFEMANTQIDGRFYHLLFTSKEHLENALELFPEDHYYSQIIDVPDLVKYFKENDTQGVLVNFPDELHYISTEELIGLDIKENLKLRKSLEVVFEV